MSTELPHAPVDWTNTSSGPVTDELAVPDTNDAEPPAASQGRSRKIRSVPSVAPVTTRESVAPCTFVALPSAEVGATRAGDTVGVAVCVTTYTVPGTYR